MREVLRDDGVVWLVLGDSYNAGDASPRRPSSSEGYGKHNWVSYGNSVRAFSPDLKAKDLIGVPWRVALALQADGWYLRAEVIWSKPNPLPSSVTDRPTYAHEQVFLLTKSPSYFYDSYAVREDDVGGHSSGNSFSGRQGGSERVGPLSGGEGTKAEWTPGGGRNRRSVWTIATEPYPDQHFAVFPKKLVVPCLRAGTPQEGSCAICGAPQRRMLIETGRMIKQNGAGSVRAHLEANGPHGETSSLSTGFSPEKTTGGWRPTCACGAPDGVAPDDLDLIATPLGNGSKPDPSLEVGRGGYSRPRNEGEGTRTITRYQQRGYAKQLRALERPCEVSEDAWAHYIRTDATGARPLPPALLNEFLAQGKLEPVEPPDWLSVETKPAVVLDPFCGAGTAGVVSLREGRSFIGIELNANYAEQARQRIRDDAPLLNVGAEIS